MKNIDIINYLLEGPEKEHFKRLLEENGFLIEEKELYYKEPGFVINNKYGHYFSLRGENNVCLLEWLINTVKKQTQEETKKACKVKFINNLHKLIE